MSVFVLDYDHNAPTTEHLTETFEPFYRAVRAKHPDMPILFVTAPDTHQYIHGSTARDTRRAVIYSVYRKALAEGDRNIHYIDGDTLFEGEHHDIYTVDGCHPTDAGAICMADRIGHVLATLL
jgi:lysophospholipase L1-like esterase